MGFFNDPTAYVVGYDDGRGVKIPAKDFVSASSGGGSMLVTISVDVEASIEKQEIVLVVDKTYDEIITAANAGMTVTAKFVRTDDSMELKMEVFLFLCEMDNNVICFATIPVIDMDTISNMSVEIRSDNTIGLSEKSIQFNDTAIANWQ